jgi:hypothetical protein
MYHAVRTRYVPFCTYAVRTIRYVPFGTYHSVRTRYVRGTYAVRTIRYVLWYVPRGTYAAHLFFGGSAVGMSVPSLITVPGLHGMPLRRRSCSSFTTMLWPRRLVLKACYHTTVNTRRGAFSADTDLCRTDSHWQVRPEGALSSQVLRAYWILERKQVVPAQGTCHYHC